MLRSTYPPFANGTPFSTAADEAFALNDAAAQTELQAAHALIAPMFWGRRTSLEDSCGLIREWLQAVG